MGELNYEQDISIDCDALDVEWVKQPDLMRRYADHAAVTKKEVDESKERLDVVRARLDREVRSNPGKYGLDKLTESVVQSTILLQDEYQEASQEYIDAKYEYDIATSAVRAVDQKKTALENLVRLLAASYFAGPQTPRNLSREWLEESERRAQNTKIKITRGRKEEMNE